MTAPTYDELAAVVVGLQVRIAEQDAKTSLGFAHHCVEASLAGSRSGLAVLIRRRSGQDRNESQTRE